MEHVDYSGYTPAEVIDIIYSNLDERAIGTYSITYDNDNDSGEMILTLPDGSTWVIRAKKLED